MEKFKNLIVIRNKRLKYSFLLKKDNFFGLV